MTPILVVKYLVVFELPLEIGLVPKPAPIQILAPNGSDQPLDMSGEAHLRRTVKIYAAYYNQIRTHLALVRDALDWRPSEAVGAIVAIPILGGLHHQYVRV